MAFGFLGDDMRINFAKGDIYPIPAGDLYTTNRAELVLQDVWLRLTTPKGDLWSHPTYGVDVYEWLHCENTMLNRMALCAYVRDEIRKDPRVVPSSISVEVQNWNFQSHELVLDVRFGIVGMTNTYNLVVGWDLEFVTDRFYNSKEGL